MSTTANYQNQKARQVNHTSSDIESDLAERTKQKSVVLNQFFQGTVATEKHFNKRLSSLAEKTEIPLAVYLHIPFGPYQLLTDTGQNIASRGSEEVTQYIDVVEHEIQLITQRIGKNRHIGQLHLGGSAPNSISQKHLVRLYEIIERYFHVDASTETSLSADPGRTSFAQVELLNGLGFKQINYGIFDLDSSVQETIGRVQSPEMIKEVFQASREAGFELVTSDLLYGLPNQTASGMHTTIERYLDINPDRITCRCYKPNPTNALNFSSYAGQHQPSLADKMATFHAVVDGLTSKGYEWIGLDCFARISDPLMSESRRRSLRRNRIGYSTMATSEFLGFGTNAISEIGGVSIQNHTRIDQWSTAVGHGGLPMARGIKLSGKSQRRREAMSDLMCNMQTDDVESLTNDEQAAIQIRRYQQDGLLEITDDCAKVTAAGQFFLSQLWDDVLPSALPH